MSGMGPIVLIADDDESLREATALLLEAEGYAVVTACDGGEALRQVDEANPAAVLLDMMMPEVDGLQFLDRLRRERARGAPVVIACSGFDRLEELALTRGASAFLKKPIDARHLLDVLAMLLARRAVSGDATSAQEAAHRDAVAEADRRRERIIHRARLDTPAFRDQLRQLVAWLTRYFSAEVAIVGLVHCDRIFVLACAGTDQVGEDACLDLDSSYCPDVTRAATPLIVRETGAGSLFAGHPAADSGLPFYAGAPLLADGISVGTLCLRGSRPFVVHAEDMAILGHFAQRIGRSIHDFATRALELFRADGLLGAEHLPILVESALFRAHRDRSAVALAVVEAQGVEQLGRAAFARADARYTALASLAPGEAAVLVEGGTPADARERLAAGLDALAAREAVRAAITVRHPVCDGTLDPARLLAAALSAPRAPIFRTGGSDAQPPPR